MRVLPRASRGSAGEDEEVPPQALRTPVSRGTDVHHTVPFEQLGRFVDYLCGVAFWLLAWFCVVRSPKTFAAEALHPLTLVISPPNNNYSVSTHEYSQCSMLTYEFSAWVFRGGGSLFGLGLRAEGISRDWGMEYSAAEASAQQSRVSRQRPGSSWVAVKELKLSYHDMGVYRV